MEYDYYAFLPRLPVLQSMGAQESKYIFELDDGISRGRPLAQYEPILGYLGCCMESVSASMYGIAPIGSSSPGSVESDRPEYGNR